MFSKLNRLLLVPAIAMVALALPAGASAAVYCVDMGAACPLGGTASASLTAAIGSANAQPDEDWIHLGPGMQSVVTMSVTQPTHIVGSGRGSTRIEANPGIGSGLTLGHVASTISGLTIASPVASTAAVLVVTGATGGEATVHDVRVEGPSSGIRANGAARLERLDVALSTDPALNRFGVIVANDVVGGGVGVRLVDSTIKAARAVSSTGTGSVRIDHSQLTYSRVGVTAHESFSTSLESTSVEVVDSVLRLAPFGDASTATRAFAVGATPSSGATAVNTTNLHVVGTTVDGTGMTGGSGLDTILEVVADANNVSVGDWHYATARATLAGVAVLGEFDRSIDVTQATEGAREVNRATVQILNSLMDLASSRVSVTGAATVAPVGNDSTVIWTANARVVDAAAGDYRPRAGSPLIDVGVVSAAGTTSSGVDFRGMPREMHGRADIGAYEYEWTAPTVTATGPTGAIAPGGSVTVTAAGTDADPGESAQLTYAWALPGGGAATGAAATFAAPTTPGLHVATVTVTDPAGVKTAVPVAFSVGVAPYVAPTDKLAPMVQFGKLKASLATLLKRKAASFKLELSEAATVRASAVVTVRQPAKKRGGKPKLVKVTVGASLPTALSAGFGTIKVTASKNGAALLAKALKVRGAKVASTMLVGSATDPSGNKRAFSTPVAITK